VALDGGAPITITPVREIWGADWNDDGAILYAVRGPVLYRVPDEGGTPAEIAVDFRPPSSSRTLDPAPVRWPELLPGGRHALVSADNNVAVVNLGTGEVTTLFRGRQPHYLPTGHLLYDEDEGHIRVVPFDADRLQVTGDPEPAFEAFRTPGSGSSQFAVSRNGTVVYVAGGFARSLVLTDEAGRATTLPLQPRGYRFPRFSPDGARIAVTVDPRPSETWLVDLRRESAVPVIRGRHTILPFWSPDGSRIGYWGAAIHAVRWPSVDSGDVLFPPLDRANFWPFAWVDERIVGELVDTLGRRVAWFAPGDTALTILAAPGTSAFVPDVSPDGSLLAYVSEVSGVGEVYARPFDGSGEAMLISAGGGTDPHWTEDGRSIVYRNGNRIMRTDLRPGPGIELAGRPRELFTAPFDFSQGRNWDVDRNGRFVFVKSDPATVGRLLVITNWFTELQARP
jgi:hypothetical protein